MGGPVGGPEEMRGPLLGRRAELVTLANRLGWSFLVHHTDRPASEPLLTLIMRLQGGADHRWQGQEPAPPEREVSP